MNSLLIVLDSKKSLILSFLGIFGMGLILFLVEISFLRWLVILPCLVGMIDLIENIQICLMLNQFPDISIAQVEFANSTTMLKHLLVKVLYACIIFLAIFKIGKKVLPK